MLAQSDSIKRRALYQAFLYEFILLYKKYLKPLYIHML